MQSRSDMYNDTEDTGNVTYLMYEDDNETNDTSEETPFDRNALIQILIGKYSLQEFGQYYPIIFPITFTICIIGIITNSFNIVVFTRPAMFKSINVFLLSLSVADIILMLSQLPVILHYFAGFQSLFEYFWWWIFISFVFLENLGMVLCNWLVVAVGVWRLIAIQWPFRSRELCSVRRAKIILVLISVLALGVASITFAILGVDRYDADIYAKGQRQIFLDNKNLLKAVWSILLFSNLIPSILQIVVTFFLIRSLIVFKIKRGRTFLNNKEPKEVSLRSGIRTTAMLTILLILFLLNNLPDLSYGAYKIFNEGQDTDRNDGAKATDVLRVFSMANNAVTFFIYYLMGHNFRYTFKECFRCGMLENPRKDSSAATNTSGVSSRKGSSFQLSIFNLDPRQLKETSNV